MRFLNMRTLEVRFWNVAHDVSIGFLTVLFSLWLTEVAHYAVNIERAEKAQIARAERYRVAEKLLAHVRPEKAQAETICLGNIIDHEVGGELEGVRRLVATVVLAMRDDVELRLPKTVCGLAKYPRLFSNLKNPDVPKRSDRAWLANFLIADEVYRDIWREQLLPRGWECVRNFMISDAYLASLNQRRRAQLGITPEERGIDFFRRHLEEVDTRGRKSFYQPKGGCDNPLPTT